MNRLVIIPFAILYFAAGVVKSQAPVTGVGIATSLQTLIESNKATIDKQTKTLQFLDQLDQDSQDLKAFAKRG